MSLRKLPEVQNFSPPRGYSAEAPSDVLERWAASAPAAAADDDATIGILDPIGAGLFGDGVTAKRVSAALRAIGERDVTVRINSPGGDMFEGIAIYNVLRQHPARVNVEIVGWAASAASIIAMAGDDIAMGLGTFVMVHNAWGLVIGNRHDMRAAADLFGQFDGALVDIYAARTDLDDQAIREIMDAETFMNPKTAIDNGFADRIDEELPAADAAAKASPAASDPGLMARRRIEAALGAQGVPRGDRSQLIACFSDYLAERDAGHGAERDAGASSAAIRRLIDTLRR